MRTTRRLGIIALCAVAVAGSAAMAAASWSLGALPVAWSPHGQPGARVGFYLGLGLFSAAWLLVGRRLLAADPDITTARLRALAIGAAAPFLLAAPLGRDLWAYAAQGHLTGRGLDPYVRGPADAPGRFSAEVSARWQHSPAPYGPLWLRLSQLGAWAGHGHPLVSALLLRVPAFLGLVLCCWAVPALAARLGGRAAPGLWLGAAGPLMIVLGVGGGHNDLIMLGIALAGLALAARPGLAALAAGAALAGVAVMIKSPAAVVVAFTVPVWLAANAEPRTVRRVVEACGVAIAGSGAVIAAVSAVSGLGFGWVEQVNSDAQWVSWLSLPSGLTMLGKAVTGRGHVRDLDQALRTVRTVGEVVAVLIVLGLWWWAVRARAARAPLGALAAALGALALLGPSVQPWYYLWGLVGAGVVVRRRRAVIVLAAVALMFPVMITPSGRGWESDWRAPIVIAAAGLAAYLALRNEREPGRTGVHPGSVEPQAV